MTIASEITRLQNDKAAMCAAIENKWVTVGNVTLDDYASCIDAIQTWWSTDKTIDLLVVWGGWWWGYYWWWGWWGVVYKEKYAVDCLYYNICIGNGGWYSCTWWGKWWNSYFGNVIWYWWWGWGWCCSGQWYWRDWGSWWWATFGYYRQNSDPVYTLWWHWCCWQWNDWWAAIRYGTCSSAWWGWWAGGAAWYVLCGNGNAYWWNWLWVDISWNTEYYWAWWAGWHTNSGGTDAYCWWCGWWWNTASNGTWYWAWWWWNGGAWHCWIVIIRYHTDWSDNICCASWWCKYECWDYTIHCFTSWWIFLTDASDNFLIDYLMVWWGTGGNWCTSCRIWWWGGWWWQVLVWQTVITSSPYNISIWCGWAGAVSTRVCVLGCPWWDTCFNWMVAHWGTTTLCGRSTRWNDSWSWCKWWCSNNYWWGGWWWAWWAWCQNGSSWTCWAQWWNWICWYGGWGWWGAWCSSSSPWAWKDWWGKGWYSSNAWCPWQNCWWGWGWASCAAWSRAGDWACGVVDICYPIDWSYWFTVATWWDCCYLCWDICVHRFTSDWTFTIVS